MHKLLFTCILACIIITFIKSPFHNQHFSFALQHNLPCACMWGRFGLFCIFGLKLLGIHVGLATVKVHLTPKYFFRLNKSLHLFKIHWAFLSLLKPNLDYLEAIKVTSHLSPDRASEGHGSIPYMTSHTTLHAFLQRLNLTQISLWHQVRNRPMPLSSSVVRHMMARFRNFCRL